MHERPVGFVKRESKERKEEVRRLLFLGLDFVFFFLSASKAACYGGERMLACFAAACARVIENYKMKKPIDSSEGWVVWRFGFPRRDRFDEGGI